MYRQTDDLSYPALGEICTKVIDTPKFGTQYGSAGDHHHYPGGLLIHTAEVVGYAVSIADMFDEADLDVIVTAGIFHDYMKIDEYERRAIDPYKEGLVVDVGGKFGPVACGKEITHEIVKTDYRKLVRHVAGSHAAFLVMLREADRLTDLVPANVVVGIEHAILAHHGRYEWGSPVLPQTLEATILHNSDVLSQKFGYSSKEIRA